MISHHILLVAGYQSSLYRPAGTLYLMATDTRHRILAALRAVLARGGASAVTLESVAAEAGVSKGGLLYHFPNKEAMYAGLLDLEIDGVTEETGRLTADRGPARAYLEYSLPKNKFEADYFSALIAAVRSQECLGEETSQKLAEIFRRWDAPLLAGVHDVVTAQNIRLVGLGLYLGAVAGLPTPDPAVITEMFDRLVATTEATATR